MLFALVNFGRHLKIDPEAALSGTNEKFRIAAASMSSGRCEQAGSSLEEATLDEMEALWQRAKAAE